MIQRNILFLISLLSFPLLTFSLERQDTKTDKVQQTKISRDKNIFRVLEGKEIKTLAQELDIYAKNFNQYNQKEMKIDNEKKVKIIENLRNKFYLNFSFGSASLKDYDVYDNSTNKAIWDDRYTKIGSSFELGFGYDFGKIRTEISYARENGRFDEYLTYSNNNITRIDKDRGKLHKDFYIINTYYDFRDDKRISPFIGLGIGFLNSIQDSAPFIPGYERQVLVLQLKGGLSYKLSKTNIIFVEGFTRNADSHTTNDGLGTPYVYEAKNGFDSFGIQIGLRKFL
tara:strand:+ start:333 stop:1184 length:852 start_codon:yes stop_codon:yes gene_type:complete